MKAATITIDGKAIGFVARKAPHTGDDACKGCLFDKKHSLVCGMALALAHEVGQPGCGTEEVGFIYVEADPRQLVLDEEVLP
ncbi:hypothetical protein CR152_27805 [Massilia violaceinigra]|uniref:Uncharacterized protein n=1 Tax=Massilia violaceinigra TaxID=2045208 RepID=A0A2D2DSC4_9BURK|nr:hypothetical protein [Massilia violaceinigra]ATQ77883.1 hypothetical protein CR152_27805 [Massilia violaceinigra]